LEGQNQLYSDIYLALLIVLVSISSWQCGEATTGKHVSNVDTF